MNILEALDDPNLFGGMFDGPSWKPWRAFLAALFGLPLAGDDLATFQALTGRHSAPLAAFAEAALIVGRRGGKSRMLALIATFLATVRDYTPYLAPGEVATVAVLAANRSQARSIFRYVSGMLNARPMLKALVQDETGEAIALSNRVVIEISTASFRTTRGYSFAAVLCDEIAFWRSDETSANPDVEILRALRPGMASIPGSILLLASSPYAKKGALYAAYRRHYGKDDARVLVWKAPTSVMNTRIDPAIIAEAYEDDPESARAEYGAEFRDDLADFITRETIDAVTCWGRRELPYEPGITYAAFCDPSGGASDAMTLAIGHLRDGEIGVLDAVLEVRPPFDPDKAVEQCAALLRRFGIARVTGDRYAGQWPVARFAAHGITFEQSARPKNDLYHDFLPLANAKRIELLECPRLSAQLVGLERRTARSGKDSIDHGPGGHDDLANAVAGVLVGLELDRRPAMVKPGDLLVDGSAAPELTKCDGIFCTLAADEMGMAAVIFGARSSFGGIPLVFVDFEVAPLSAGLFRLAAQRCAELCATHGARNPGTFMLATAPMVRLGATVGIKVEPIPEELSDAGALALSAGWHVASGSVKMSALVRDKARSSPFGGALNFKVGADMGDDPLRAAALYAIVVALNDPLEAEALN